VANDRELKRQALTFANRIESLLNRTVCDHARCGRSDDPQSHAKVVGTCVTDRSALTSPVRLRTADASTSLWLDVGYRVVLDDQEQKFLTVETSWFSVNVGPDAQNLKAVVHYDYERGKMEKDGYPEAHIQVFGEHPEFIAFARQVGAKDQLGRYHLPVGGRRMRPSLEDVLEWLIVEKLVVEQPGWKAELAASRKAYRKSQIAALVRRNHGTAIDELERMGYKITGPTDARLKVLAKQLLGLLPKQAEKGKSKKR
jgi:hypothetical protein